MLELQIAICSAEHNTFKIRTLFLELNNNKLELLKL